MSMAVFSHSITTLVANHPIKLISELNGITFKAIAKAVEGMDNESYNQGQGLQPVINRLTRAAFGEPSKVMSIKDVLGVE